MITTKTLTLWRFVPLQNGRCFTTMSQRVRLNKGNSFGNMLKKRQFETEAKSGWRSWERTAKPTGFTGYFIQSFIFNGLIFEHETWFG